MLYTLTVLLVLLMALSCAKNPKYRHGNHTQTSKDGAVYEICEIDASNIERVFVPKGAYKSGNTVSSKERDDSHVRILKKINGGHKRDGKNMISSSDDTLLNSSGCVFRKRGKDLHIATYGEYHYVDGGNRILLDIQVPQNVNIIFTEKLNLYNTGKNSYHELPHYGWKIIKETPVAFYCAEINEKDIEFANPWEQIDTDSKLDDPKELVEWIKCKSLPTEITDIRELDEL